MAKKSDLPAEQHDLADRLLDTVNSSKPTKAQLAELRAALRTAPALVEELGAMGNQIKHMIAEGLTGQPGLHITVKAKADAMAKDLGAEGASPLEKLLIDQVVVAWLRWVQAELTYQQIFQGQGVSLQRASYLEKRLTATHGRYLRSIESLARVRRLLARAPMQVNIAQQQIVQNS